jgi:predicted dehydrogenase
VANFIEENGNLIRVGLIGCGYWGPNLVRTLHDIEGVQLVRVADLRPGRREFISKRYPGLQATAEYREITSDPSIDAVVIASPPDTHFQLAMEALEQGKHLLVEKPLAMKSREADEIVRFAAERDRVLMVGHLFLYAPAVVKLNYLIEQGELGDLYCLSSIRANPGPPNTKVDALWDLAPHDFSIILHLFNELPVEVAAHAASFSHHERAEVVFVFLRFASGRAAHVHVSWLTPNKTRRMDLLGSKRVACYDDMQPVHKLMIFDAADDNRRDATARDSKALSYGTGNVWIPALQNYEPLRAECEDFVSCIRTRETPVSDGRKGAEVVRILERASNSIGIPKTPELVAHVE